MGLDEGQRRAQGHVTLIDDRRQLARRLGRAACVCRWWCGCVVSVSGCGGGWMCGGGSECVCVCVCVCVCDVGEWMGVQQAFKERERERERECVCVCVMCDAWGASGECGRKY